MLKHYIEELNLIFMERLEYIESVEDYLILKEQIEELNNCYKDLYKLLDKESYKKEKKLLSDLGRHFYTFKNILNIYKLLIYKLMRRKMQKNLSYVFK